MSQSSGTRIAIVTGSAQGIGRAIALKLADDGLDIVVNDIEAKASSVDEVVKEIVAKGRKAVAICADISNEASVQALVDQTVEHFGGLDVMVANAGVFAMGPLLDVTAEQWDKVVSINSRGVLFLYQAAARQMIKQGRGGRIVGACSDAGKKGYQMLSIYGASKAAVRTLTQSASTEFWKHGITVNCYAPGAIFTDMVAFMTEEDGAGGRKVKGGVGSDAVPVGAPEDVASLVSFIVSPGARWITGQTIHVNAGALFE
ncbi:hypothetical protein JAAARDRAFT_59199 [Jaapia argillacea MUCL 33604]|uniref:Uncharacterized protein n=1 Tax=Jaapia argillacea MUCL 33604 TaxID=933084 RepID=A0A067PNC4_9AGAM|nr:hypothetical protein JAAARDRAFT_59199 [Jaapia argillacea MUCL 33604]